MSKVKKGYKDTEVGTIPEDWDVKTIGEILQFYPTASYSRAQMQSEGEYACVHYGDIHTKFNHFINFEKTTLPHVTKKQAARYTQLENGDLVMADASEDYIGVGKAIEVINTGKKAIAGLHTLLMRDKESHFVNGYKGYLFQNINVKRSLDRIATGLKVYGISKKSLIDILLPIPPKQEQQAIAEALSDIDVLINALSRQIEKKKNIKHGAMQELLTGKKRLQGFVKQWKEITLFEIAGKQYDRFIDGDWIESPHIIDSGIRLIQTGNIGVGYFKDNNKKFISESSFNLLKCKEVVSGDILVCRLAEPAGRACIAPNLPERMITSVDVTIFKPLDDSYDRRFISYIINTNNWFKDIAEKCGGTTRTRIARSKLGDISLILPPTKEEQTAIAQILTDMDNEIEQLEKKRDKYLNIKSGMMQQLLTGQIRLTNTVSYSASKEIKIEDQSSNKKKHSKQFDEAVIISFLVDKFGSAEEPLSRFMYTKLSYLIHRKHDCKVVDFKKFAAGPYNPKSRYGGPESIGKEKKYFDSVKDAKGYDAFAPMENIQEAVNYFTQWYGSNIQNWVQQFGQYKPWGLETLATVDMAISDLREKGIESTVASVKTYLSSIPKWQAKLNKPHFSDRHIQHAIDESIRLFKI